MPHIAQKRATKHKVQTKGNNMYIKEIKDEIRDYLEESKSEYREGITFEEIAHERFNNDYYIIGYYECNQWLENHDIGQFEALQWLIDYEKENFGEHFFKIEDINSETVVNRICCHLALEIAYELDCQ